MSYSVTRVARPGNRRTDDIMDAAARGGAVGGLPCGRRQRPFGHDGRAGRGNRVVLRTGGGNGPGFRALQRHVRPVLLPEVMAPGVALLDYDNDGDLDVFLVQGQMLGPGDIGRSGAVPLRAARRRPRGRLYRNDLSDQRRRHARTLRFTDVTAASGLTARGYGMGVAAGDFDNDGCADLYLTNLGPNQLFRNNCDGTFSDVSAASRTDDPRMERLGGVRRLSIATAGWICSSATTELQHRHQHPMLPAGGRTGLLPAAGLPGAAEPAVSQQSRRHVHRRDRGGRPVALEFGPALGVSTADFNGDGWIDLYVANDGQPNQLWINQHDGTFKNTGLLSGTAVDENGKAKSSMGVDAGDFDNDGDEDLFVTELTGQGSDLYVNDGAGVFEDRSARAGIRFATPALHRLRRRLARLRQRRLAGHPDRQRRGDARSAAAPGIVLAAAAETAAPQSRRRPVRGRDRPGRAGVRAVGGRPRRGVRRRRQRRRHRRRRRQRQRPGPAADQQHRQPQPLDRHAPRRQRRPPATCSARGSGWSAPTARCSGGGRGPTAAMPRPTIRACWSALAARPRSRRSR